MLHAFNLLVFLLNSSWSRRYGYIKVTVKVTMTFNNKNNVNIKTVNIKNTLTPVFAGSEKLITSKYKHIYRDTGIVTQKGTFVSCINSRTYGKVTKCGSVSNQYTYLINICFIASIKWKHTSSVHQRYSFDMADFPTSSCVMCSQNKCYLIAVMYSGLPHSAPCTIQPRVPFSPMHHSPYIKHLL